MAKPIPNEVDCPALEQVRKLNKAIIGNHNFSSTTEEEPKEQITEKSVQLSDEDLILFKKDDIYGQTMIISQTELQNSVRDMFKNLFCDVYGCAFNYEPEKGYYFRLDAKYNPEEPEEGQMKIIESSMNPDNISKNSIASTLLKMTQQQTINSYDASKYAKITSDAKSIFTPIIWCSKTNKKKNWNKGENYTLNCSTGNSAYNNVSYTNIVCSIFIDAQKLFPIIAGDEDGKKYIYTVRSVANNLANNDTLFKIERIYPSTKRHVSNKYGAQIIT